MDIQLNVLLLDSFHISTFLQSILYNLPFLPYNGNQSSKELYIIFIFQYIVQWLLQLWNIFLFSTSSYCSPTTPRRVYHGTAEAHSGLQYYTAGPAAHVTNLQYPSSTLHYNPAAFTSPVQYSTQKKRTLVQYKYPDVLPSEKLNQNYYVWSYFRLNKW